MNFDTSCKIKSMEMVMDIVRQKRRGRPRVIPPELEAPVIQLHEQGYGYRAIARILRNEYHINPHFSSVRQTLIRLGIVVGNKGRTDEGLSRTCRHSIDGKSC